MRLIIKTVVGNETIEAYTTREDLGDFFGYLKAKKADLATLDVRIEISHDDLPVKPKQQTSKPVRQKWASYPLFFANEGRPIVLAGNMLMLGQLITGHKTCRLTGQNIQLNLMRHIVLASRTIQVHCVLYDFKPDTSNAKRLEGF